MTNHSNFEEAWAQLDRIPADNLRGRWMAPLVDSRWVERISDMSQAAHSYLEDCGWLDVVNDAPAFQVHGRTVDAGWVKAMTEAANLLAEAGENAGPESSVEIWLSWLCWEMAGPHDWLTETLGVGESP